MRQRPLRFCFAFMLCAVMVLHCGMTIGAEPASFKFNIESQPLGIALQKFAKQSGLQIVFLSKITDGLKAPAVKGHYSVDGALQRLLEDSKLTYRRLNEKTIEIRPLSDDSTAPSGTNPAGTRVPSGQVQAVPEGTSETNTAAREADRSGDSSAPELKTLSAVVITGTHLSGVSGYNSPTPVTMIGVQQIQDSGKANLADVMNEMPAVVGSATPANSNLSFSDGQAGINALNLRGLGTDRTLVLIDGQRSVGSTITGVVDINDIPQALVKRVDIVTGGASAVYGSDAVAGVVNFILDKDFTGFKAEASGGETASGDNPTEKLTVTAGVPFAAGRGHFLINAEYNHIGGIYGVPRSWNNQGRLIMSNPSYQPGNGLPQLLSVAGAGLDEATLGGIITNTALRGVTFGPGGTPSEFEYGRVTDDPFTQGGEWQSNQFNYQNTLDPQSTRENLFSYASYDLTDKVTAYGEASFNEDQENSEQLLQFNVGNIVIKAGDPFIPASVAQQMTALGISTFKLGTMNGDIPPIRFNGTRMVSRFVGGLKGTFDMFGKTWNWDAYYQDGIMRSYETGYDITSKSGFADALDAVTDPTTGSAVCRITLTDPASSCLPYDPMGLGVNSQATIDSLIGSPHRYQRFTEDVQDVVVNGRPFSVWAGPVGIAFGVDHRREAVTGYADPNSLASNWFAGNYLPTFGSYRVTEGFAETDIPLLKNEPLAQTLDFNGAMRITDYSTSGRVTTWKLGGIWQPVHDLHFRVTRSRDIRAPNLNDLFAAGTANTNNVIDDFNNNANVAYQGKAVGNPNLKPEVADTAVYGVVLTPRFAHLAASVDYYDTKLHDAIGSVSAQTIVDNCFEGLQSYCGAITRGTGAGGASVITQILIEPFNLVEIRDRGVDLEASYRFDLSSIDSSWRGGLTLHALATHYIEFLTNNGINPPVDTAGTNGTFSGTALPSWIFHSTISYSNNPVTVALTARGFSAGTNSNQYIQCTSGCPLSRATAPTINDNHAPGAFYLDLYGSYKFDLGTGVLEAFANITNVGNRDPGFVPNGPSGLPYAELPTNESLYDILGRTYRVGVRILF